MKYVRPHVLAILPAFIPSTFINIVNPLLKLHRSGNITAKIDLESLSNRRNLEWADLVVFCRNTEPWCEFILHFLLSRKIPFIYDLDDNFFEISLDSEIGRYHRAPERLAMLNRYLESANLVRVYSMPLFERVQTINRAVEMVSAAIDFRSISSPGISWNKRIVKIVYATSRIEDELSAIFVPALEQVLNQYAGKVSVHFWGLKLSGIKSTRGVHYRGLIPNYKRFLQQFSKAGFDIGLAPLKDDIFHRSKTNNKFREYGACQIAGIYSNVDVYSSCVTDRKTGLLVSNEPESWYEAIVRLIEDNHLREKIKMDAYYYVRRHYSQENFEKVWWNQIQRILKEGAVTSASGNVTDGAIHFPRRLDRTLLTRGASRQRKNESLFTGESAQGDSYLSKKRETLLSLHNIAKLMMHLKRNGVSDIFRMFQQLLSDIWMVLKFRFLTSPVFGIFNRRRFSPQVLRAKGKADED